MIHYFIDKEECEIIRYDDIEGDISILEKVSFGEEEEVEEVAEEESAPTKKPEKKQVNKADKRKRREDILRELADGVPKKEIAEKYGMTVAGVDYYKHSEAKKKKADKDDEPAFGEKLKKFNYKCRNAECKAFDKKVVSTTTPDKMRCPDCGNITMRLDDYGQKII